MPPPDKASEISLFADWIKIQYLLEYSNFVIVNDELNDWQALLCHFLHKKNQVLDIYYASTRPSRFMIQKMLFE
jgi:hypothetical protein